MAATHTLVTTGASRGIGRIAADHILTNDPDAHLVVVARGEGGRTLAAELRDWWAVGVRGGGGPGSLESLRAGASEVAAQLESGQLPPLRGFVGYEATFTVNVVANHLFVRPPAVLRPGLADHHHRQRHALRRRQAHHGHGPRPGLARAGPARQDVGVRQADHDGGRTHGLLDEQARGDLGLRPRPAPTSTAALSPVLRRVLRHRPQGGPVGRRRAADRAPGRCRGAGSEQVSPPDVGPQPAAPCPTRPCEREPTSAVRASAQRAPYEGRATRSVAASEPSSASPSALAEPSSAW